MNKKILIIDDNSYITKAMYEILNEKGYDIVQTGISKTDIRYALKNKPDIILCRFILPGLDGFSILRSLRHNNDTAVIPFVFLISETDRFDYRKCLEMDADGYISKPFTITELLNIIEKKLNKFERQKAYFMQGAGYCASPKKSRPEPKSVNDLADMGKIQHLKKRETLYIDGAEATGIYVITCGSIKTVKKTTDGKEFITGLYKTDDYLGVNAYVRGTAFDETAITLEDTEVCLLPKATVATLLDQHPALNAQLLKILSCNIHEKEEQMMAMAYQSVRKRLAQLLLTISKHNNNLKLLNICREELAAMAGMAAETISRTLGDFKEEGIIDKDTGYVHIIDPTRLENMKN